MCNPGRQRISAVIIGLFLFSLTLLPVDGRAQQVGADETVSGVVVDASNGDALPGANVLVKGTTVGTSTDVNGAYELSVPSLNDTLVVSFVGFQPREIPIGGRTTVDVRLQPQAINAEEVVVIGYGSVQQRELTGSVSSVSAGAACATSSSARTASQSNSGPRP